MVGGVVAGLVLAVVERVLWIRGDNVDGVVGRLVGKWRWWRREGGCKKKTAEGMEASNVMEATSRLPRFRETLLEQFPMELEGNREKMGEEEKERKERKKGWHFKRKSQQQSYNLTVNSGSGSSSVASISVGVADLDSGLATIHYSRHDSK